MNGLTMIAILKAHAGDLGSVPGLGRSPGEEKGCPLQCSGLENPVGCGVHAVSQCEQLPPSCEIVL